MQHLYFIGLEYPTMTGLAMAAKELGFIVSGSGSSLSPSLAHQLKEAGLHYYDRYAASHLAEDCVVVISPDTPVNNPELQQARQRQLEIISQAQLIQQLSQNQQRLVVLGSSLAAAQIYQTLQVGGQTAVDYIGRQPLFPTQDNPQPRSVIFQASPQLVIEANLDPSSCLDQASQALYYQPHLLVIISPEDGYHHTVAYYKTLQHLLSDMVEVDCLLPIRVILVGQDKKALDLVIRSGLTYQTGGLQARDDWQAKKIDYLPQKTVGWLYQGKQQIDMVSLPHLGQQALWSALASLAVDDLFQIDQSQALLAITGQSSLYYQGRHWSREPDNRLVQILLDQYFTTDLQLHLAKHLQANPPAEEQHLWLILLDHHPQTVTRYHRLIAALPHLDILLISDSAQPQLKLSQLTKTASAVYCMSIDQMVRFTRQNIGHNDLLLVVSSAESNLTEAISLYRGLGLKLT